MFTAALAELKQEKDNIQTQSVAACTLKLSETVIAYQRLRLREIRDRYEELDPDLDHYLGVESNVSEGIDTLEANFSEVRKTLISLGIDLDGERIDPSTRSPGHPHASEPRAKQAPPAIDFEDLAKRSGPLPDRDWPGPQQRPLAPGAWPGGGKRDTKTLQRHIRGRKLGPVRLPRRPPRRVRRHPPRRVRGQNPTRWRFPRKDASPDLP